MTRSLIRMGVVGAAFAVALPAAATPTRPLVAETPERPGQIGVARVCPSAPHLVGFERIAGVESLVVQDTRTGDAWPVSSVDPLTGTSTYDGQLDWMPVPDGDGRHWFTFCGGGLYNNRDVYLSYAGADRAWRLTQHEAADFTPRFGPRGRQIVFSSVRTGKGDLYVIQNVDEIRRRVAGGGDVPELELRRLTVNPERDLHPDIDPSGRFVVFAEFARSEIEATTEANMGLAVVDLENPGTPPVRLTIDAVQETRPTWSPDGSRVAFYSSAHIEDARVDVGVIQVIFDSDRGVPVRGRLVETGVGREVATGVIPAEVWGPDWLSADESGAHPQSIVYVRMSPTGQRRLVIADLAAWESGAAQFETVLELEGASSPADPTWSPAGEVVVSGLSAEGYGLFAVSAPVTTTVAQGTFAREETEAPVAVATASEGGNDRWRWIAGGIAAAAVFVLSTDSDDGNGDDPIPGDGSEIGDPPCPPGVDCR